MLPEKRVLLAITLFGILLLGAGCGRQADQPNTSSGEQQKRKAEISTQERAVKSGLKQDSAITQKPQVPTAKDIQKECPLTVELVREKCNVPEAVRIELYEDPLLKWAGAKSCNVAFRQEGESFLESGRKVSIYTTVLAYWVDTLIKQNYDETSKTYQNRKLTDREIYNRAGDAIRGVAFQGFSPFRVELKSVEDVGDSAFWGQRPLLKVDKADGKLYPGFLMYVQQGDWQAVFDSGGYETYYETGKGTYEPLGGGCSAEEVAEIAKEVAAPHLKRIAEAEKTEREQKIREALAKAERGRQNAEGRCPPLEKIRRACSGPNQPTEVQSFAHGQPGSYTCSYQAGLPTDFQEALTAYFGAPELRQPYVTAVIFPAKNSGAALFSYGLVVEPALEGLIEGPVLGRDEIGLKSIRKARAMGFATENKIVQINVLNEGETCRAHELRGLGEIFD